MLVIRTIRPQETPSSSEANDDVAGHLEGCVQGGLSREERAKLNCKAALLDCDQALDLESGSVKARYRKAQALKGLGKILADKGRGRVRPECTICAPLR